MNKIIFSTACAALALTATNASAQLLSGTGGLGVGDMGGGITSGIGATAGRMGTTFETSTRVSREAARASRDAARAKSAARNPHPDAAAAGNATALNGRATGNLVATADTATRRASANAALTVARPPSVAAPVIAVPAAQVAASSVSLGYVGGADVAVIGRQQALINDGIVFIPAAQVPLYVDREVVVLERELAGTGVEIERRGKQIFIQMPADVTFAFDKSDIQTRFLPALNALSRTLNQFPATYVDVVGHTDAIGSDAYNQSLSERRADAVADYLVYRHAEPDRIYVAGQGESEPIASNASISGRAANRRVEIVLTPHEGPA